jgi:hypothetical protein
MDSGGYGFALLAAGPAIREQQMATAGAFGIAPVLAKSGR